MTAFRDDREALRAHVETLETELAQARRALDAHEGLEDEVGTLRTRVADLEAKLARALETPTAKAAREAEEKARVAKERAAQAAGAAPGRQQRAAVGVIAGFLTVGALGLFFALNDCGPPAWRARDAAPSLGVVHTADLREPLRFAGSVRGTASAPRSCAGYLPDVPQLVIEAASPTTLVIEASSDTDTVLLLLTSDGHVRCDDDSAGDFDPRITTNVPAGTHRVWVGTYEQGSASIEVTVGGLAATP
jgi:hypothetical protein